MGVGQSRPGGRSVGRTDGSRKRSWKRPGKRPGSHAHAPAPAQPLQSTILHLPTPERQARGGSSGRQPAASCLRSLRDGAADRQTLTRSSRDPGCSQGGCTGPSRQRAVWHPVAGTLWLAHCGWHTSHGLSVACHPRRLLAPAASRRSLPRAPSRQPPAASSRLCLPLHSPCACSQACAPARLTARWTYSASVLSAGTGPVGSRRSARCVGLGGCLFAF